MGGWHRLFVAFSVVCAIVMSLWLLKYLPGSYEIGKYVGSSCGVFSYVSTTDAEQYLAQGRVHNPTYPNAEPNAETLTSQCREGLQSYVDGSTLKEWRLSWAKQIPYAAGFLLVFLAVVYLIGLGIGWVWRGFFPKDPPNKNPA